MKRVFAFAGGLTSSFICFNAIDGIFSWSSDDGAKFSRGKLFQARSQCVNAAAKREGLESQLELQQVQILMRHGARTPFKFIPNYEPAFWPEEMTRDLEYTMINHTVRSLDFGSRPVSPIDNAYLQRKRLNGGSVVGQLTKVGQEQMYQLGKEIKARYVDELRFLPAEFNHEDVYVRTTNILRTIKSVRCLLAGLYGDVKLTNPIPIMTSNNEHETLYPNYYFCKSLKHWAGIAWSTAEDDVPGLEDFQNQIAKDLDVDSSKQKISIIAIEDNMRSRQAHGHPVPKSLLKKWQEIEDFAVKFQMRVIAPNRAIMKLSVGGVLESVCTQLEDKSKKQSDYKMLLYSAHDTTLMAFLYALGIYDEKWPPYASNVRIELYKNTVGNWFIKILYNNREMTLPGCDEPVCSLERFLEICEPNRVKDWDADCGVTVDYRKDTFAPGTI